MTISELILRLQKLEAAGMGSHRAVVRGYEGGVDDVEDLAIMTIALNVNNQDYYGAHEPCREGTHAEFNQDHEIAFAIQLRA